MKKPKVGMVGLGSIAQKAYLPILSKQLNWTFVGAFSPNKEKRKTICDSYRIREFYSLDDLIYECDAIFVHSSTDSHYEIVNKLLHKGMDVYVDKPLASSLEQSEKLVELSEKLNRKLMIGFNRRFAPMYVTIKEKISEYAWMKIEKHRENIINSDLYAFTMLDDYLHLVDTALWLSDGYLKLLNGNVCVNTEKQLVFSYHNYLTNNDKFVITCMNRSSGTNLEQLEFVINGAIIRVKNMNTLETEQNNSINTIYSPSWQSILKQKGFEDAVQHFIDCIIGNTKPSIDGIQALKSQMLLNKLLIK